MYIQWDLGSTTPGSHNSLSFLGSEAYVRIHRGCFPMNNPSANIEIFRYCLNHFSLNLMFLTIHKGTLKSNIGTFQCM